MTQKQADSRANQLLAGQFEGGIDALIGAFSSHGTVSGAGAGQTAKIQHCAR